MILRILPSVSPPVFANTQEQHELFRVSWQWKSCLHLPLWISSDLDHEQVRIWDIFVG